jgi:two-component system, NarL family, response regulator NreC
MEQPVKLRVFLADDHAIVREGLKALINNQPDIEVVGEASDGRETVRAASACAPDIVVMDLSMPHLNGVQATGELRRSCPSARVLALSVHEETSYFRTMLEAGASGYVLKRSAADVLVTAIRAVAAGEVYLDPSLSGRIVSAFTSRPESGGPPTDLSDREADVLRLIATGYSNKEIGAQLGISVKTVETYKARAMHKLDLDGRVAIVRYAAMQGWL